MRQCERVREGDVVSQMSLRENERMTEHKKDPLSPAAARLKSVGEGEGSRKLYLQRELIWSPAAGQWQEAWSEGVSGTFPCELAACPRP